MYTNSKVLKGGGKIENGGRSVKGGRAPGGGTLQKEIAHDEKGRSRRRGQDGRRYLGGFTQEA